MLDTNVILDALMAREPWALAAQELLRTAAMDKFIAFITASQTTDIFYLLCRQGANQATAKKIIKKITGSVSVSDVTPAGVNTALDSEIPDYEVALLACNSKRQKADHIITRNKKDFINSPVPAISPEDFLEQCFSG